MRLIDADELINQGYEIVVDGLQYDTCNKSIDIDNIPTAYSVDKVVEELGKREEHYVEMLDWQGQSAICDAIEIVKHDGVPDDVCEWKQDNMCEKVYMVCGGCFTSAYQKDFKFCPYCGKKIKVVE